MFALFPGATPATLLATEKCAGVTGLASASVQYARRIKLPWKLVIMASLPAFAGAHFGARTIAILPSTWVKPFVVFLLIIMLVYTWLKPNFGKQDAHIPISRGDLIRGLLIGTAIGFYEGFFGPGAGSFLIFLFVRIFHFDFLRATACAKVVNVSTNLGALTYFIPAGLVMFDLAIPMVAAMISGAIAGSLLAMKGGNHWLRRLFLILVLSLLAKLVVDLI